MAFWKLSFIMLTVQALIWRCHHFSVSGKILDPLQNLWDQQTKLWAKPFEQQQSPTEPERRLLSSLLVVEELHWPLRSCGCKKRGHLSQTWKGVRYSTRMKLCSPSNGDVAMVDAVKGCHKTSRMIGSSQAHVPAVWAATQFDGRHCSSAFARKFLGSTDSRSHCSSDPNVSQHRCAEKLRVVVEVS